MATAITLISPVRFIIGGTLRRIPRLGAAQGCHGSDETGSRLSRTTIRRKPLPEPARQTVGKSCLSVF
jgi:hypothetical protein